jgi:hypothetical protein
MAEIPATQVSHRRCEMPTTVAVAREFGDHPDTAAGRMAWALATIRTVYPPRTTISTHSRRSLALAS